MKRKLQFTQPNQLQEQHAEALSEKAMSCESQKMEMEYEETNQLSFWSCNFLSIVEET